MSANINVCVLQSCLTIKNHPKCILQLLLRGRDACINYVAEMTVTGDAVAEDHDPRRPTNKENQKNSKIKQKIQFI